MTKSKSSVKKETPKNYIDILSNDCAALSLKFRLNEEDTDALREFVVDYCMKSWRNGRAVGWIRGKQEPCSKCGHKLEA